MSATDLMLEDPAIRRGDLAAWGSTHNAYYPTCSYCQCTMSEYDEYYNFGGERICPECLRDYIREHKELI